MNQTLVAAVSLTLVILLAPIPAVPLSLPSSGPDNTTRYLEVAEAFFNWAMSGEEYGTLGVFSDFYRLRDSELIAVSCPFVPSRDITSLNKKFFDGACCEWGMPGHTEGRCLSLSLQMEEEGPDRIVVSFTLAWSSSAGQGMFYSCEWVDGELQITRIPGRFIII